MGKVDRIGKDGALEANRPSCPSNLIMGDEKENPSTYKLNEGTDLRRIELIEGSVVPGLNVRATPSVNRVRTRVSYHLSQLHSLDRQTRNGPSATTPLDLPESLTIGGQADPTCAERRTTGPHLTNYYSRRRVRRLLWNTEPQYIA